MSAEIDEQKERQFLASALRDTHPRWGDLADAVEHSTNFENDKIHVSTAMRAISAALRFTIGYSRNALINAMQDDPFVDDLRYSGTTQQRLRCEHYADIAINLVPDPPNLAPEEGRRV